jgi:hypothetical protein
VNGRGAVLLVTAVVGVTGCSFVATRAPTRMERYYRQPITCTPRVTAPLVDTAVAAAGVLSAIVAYRTSCADDAAADCDLGRDARIIAAVPIVLAFGASAGYGYDNARQCRWLAEEAEAAALAPPRLAPPPGWVEAAPLPVAGAPPEASVPPAPAPAPQPVLATVGPAGAEVRTAPFAVAPLAARLFDGERVRVAPDAQGGWRRAWFWQGRFGYVRDADVRLDAAPASR